MGVVKIRLTQPQVELEAWAELGNRPIDLFCLVFTNWFGKVFG